MRGWVVGHRRFVTESDPNWVRTGIGSRPPRSRDWDAANGRTRVPALVAAPACGPRADCHVPHELWISDDAGLTWRKRDAAAVISSIGSSSMPLQERNRSSR